MNIEHQYLNVLKNLVHKSQQTEIRQDRTGTGTISTFGVQLRHDMSLGFPLLTTKKVHFKSIVSELLWFMRGQTDLRNLLQQKNTIWVGDAYKKYCTICKANSNEFNEWLRDNGDGSLSMFTREQFIQQILENDRFSEKWGNLGPVYGKQWRNVESKTGSIDQLQDLVTSLRETPYNRRQLVDAWNVAEIQDMTLPPCHLLYQVYVEDMSKQEMKRNPGFSKKISLQYYIRSWDVFLGGPFNIASYALLLEFLGKMTGYKPAELISVSGDTHIYSNHIEAAKLQLSREPFDLPKLQLSSDIIFDGTINDLLVSITEPDVQIQLDGYFSHSKIQAELSN
jgi:thymidylate synthase